MRLSGGRRQQKRAIPVTTQRAYQIAAINGPVWRVQVTILTRAPPMQTLAENGENCSLSEVKSIF